MSLHSRYAREKFVYASPNRSLTDYIGDINRYCEKFKADAVLPTSEAGIMACSRFREKLEKTPIIPPNEHIELMFSKARTMELARSVGVAVPRTLYIQSGQASLPLDASRLQLPIVVKSETSELLASTKTVTSRKTAYPSSRSEMERECERRLSEGHAILVQEFVDGYGLGISGLFSGGEPVALLAHRRLRESDPLGGPSALAETVELKPELIANATAIMRKIGFTGPAMVEFKVDRKTHIPYFMEINCRFWGTVLLAPAANLDLPYLYWKMLNGLAIQPAETVYRVGVKGRYLVGDTKCLLHCLRGKPRYWPGEFPSRWSAFRDYFTSFFEPDTKDLLLTLEDPVPFFARLAQDFVP